MKCFRLCFALVAAFAPLVAGAANPFLDAADDKPVAAQFRGTEWGDQTGADDLPLKARVVTTRLGTAPWGAVFRIAFEQIASQAAEKRQIDAQHFIVTDDRIILFNAEDISGEVQRLAAMPAPPEAALRDTVGISKGKRTAPEEGNEVTEISVKGDLCTYLRSHHSGHSTRYVWRKGVGLITHTYNYGARGDGYSLTRVAAPQAKAPTKTKKL